MKATVHTSMRWIQQHMRYLHYMENHGSEGQPPLSSPLPQSASEPKSTVAEADTNGPAISGIIAVPR